MSSSWIERIRRRAAQGFEGLASVGKRGATVGALNNLFAHDGDAKRRSLLLVLFGKETSKNLTDGECSAVLEWAQMHTEEEGWVIRPQAVQEADRLIAEYEESKGQQKLM